MIDRRTGAALLAALIAALVFAAGASAATGSVWTWGANGQGELGDGTNTGPQNCGKAIGPCSTTPVSVLGSAKAIAGGYDHSLAVRTNSRVYAWGHNQLGQLGNGTSGGPGCSNTCSTKPNYVRTSATHVLSGAVAVAAGANFSLALLSDGTVVAWGANQFGQLGDGTSSGPSTCAGSTPCAVRPVPVSGLSNVKAIAAGGSHALALLNDGTVMAWGSNDAGQLGDLTSSGPDTCFAGVPCSTTPVQVERASGGPLRPVSSIAAGDGFSAAVVGGLGQVDTWGANGAGQLGDGSTTGPSTCFNGEPCDRSPAAVSGLINIFTVAANGDAFQMLALRDDGSVIAWGDNEYGQVGNGCSTTFCPNPMLEGGITTATGIATSCGDHKCRSMALLSGGQAVEWGAAPLGNGSVLGPSTCLKSSCSRDPVDVTGMDAASAIATGGVHSLALAPPPPNRFSLREAQCRACQVATLKVHIPVPGVLLAFQKPTPHQASVVDARTKTLIKRVRVNATKAGTVRLKLRLTRAGKRALRQGGKLRVKVRVTFTPNGGTPASKTIKVVFRSRRR